LTRGCHAGSQEIGVQPLQLPGARPAQGEGPPLAVFGDQGVNFVQQRGNALNFIDDDPRAPGQRLHLAPERRWVGQKPQVDVGVTQVVPARPGWRKKAS
jgi:hypothetical protein